MCGRSRLAMAAAAAICLLGGGVRPAGAVTKYFDAITGPNNGVGGSGTLTAQTTALYSTTTTGDATPVAAAATDDGVFQGTAGVVTFNTTPYALNSATVNVTGYTFTPSTTMPTVTLTTTTRSPPASTCSWTTRPRRRAGRSTSAASTGAPGRG